MTVPASPTYLALGDSYTIGEGVKEAERWPVQLARQLGMAAPEMIARTGWTTDELAEAMRQHVFHPPYDLVTLLIGVNNQYRGRDVDNYRAEFLALAQRAIDLAGGRPQHVIVVSIPDWGVTPFARAGGRDRSRIAAEIDLFNTANAQIAQHLQVHYADVTQISRQEGAAPAMLVDDGLHPSATQYAAWARAIRPAAGKALSSL